MEVARCCGVVEEELRSWALGRCEGLPTWWCERADEGICVLALGAQRRWLVALVLGLVDGELVGGEGWRGRKRRERERKSLREKQEWWVEKEGLREDGGNQSASLRGRE